MDKPIPEAVVTDKLIADLLPPALIFADTDEHLAHARQRAKTILLETLTAAQQQGQAVAFDRMLGSPAYPDARADPFNALCTAPPSAPVGVDESAERKRFMEWAEKAGTYHTSGYNPHGDLWRAWKAALAQQPAAVDASGCMHGCRCGGCSACKREHYEPTRHSTCDYCATQHQEPTT